MSRETRRQAGTPLDEPRLEPWDDHNRLLVSRVHPPGWVNPEPASRYHLVVVGGGTGGLVSAAIAVALGARVALVERHLMGGDCLNYGCVPSKALLRAAHGWHAARRAHPDFAGPEAAGNGDFAAVMRRLRRIRAEIATHDSAERFRDLGVDVFLGDGRFDSPSSLIVGGARLRFRRAIVATGSTPAVPPIPGLEEAGPLTTETVFELTELPRRLAIVGGGAVGTELGQAFARLGSRVTLIEQADRILRTDDADAAELVHQALDADGVRILTGTELQGVHSDGGESVLSVRSGDAVEEIRFDRVLLAVGRSPNVRDLDLPAAGVEFTERGIVTDHRLRTGNRRVFAVGDVTERGGFTHLADAHARIAVRNALFWGRGSVDGLVVPWCTFTEPELAHVGLTADEAAQRGDEVETITVPSTAVDRPRLDDAGAGLLKIHLRRGSGVLLGATLVHPRAGDMIAVAAHAITQGSRLDSLSDTVLPYPTTAELFRRAADLRRRRKLTPRVQRGFDLFFRLFR